MRRRYRGRLFYHSKRKRRYPFGGTVFFGVCLLLFLIQIFNKAIQPQLITLTESRLCNQVILMANQAVEETLYEQGLAYTDLVILQTEKSGEITTLSTDTIHLNTLRSAVMEKLISQVEDLDTDALGIPLGVLTGIDLLSAAGPELPIKVLSVVSATGNYRNEFSTAGINQTLHQIFLDVALSARILLPGGVVETNLSVPVAIAETVIIGQVPQTYLNYNP